MRRILMPLAAVLCLAGCALAPAIAPTEQARVDTDTARIEKKIKATCLGSGLFKLADGAIATAVPAAGIPISLINAGVDVVCASPERFAGDISTLEWLGRNLREAVAKHRAT